MATVALWAVAAAACTTSRPGLVPPAGAPPPPVRLALLGTSELAPGGRFAETTIGGLSALAFDLARGEYLALSDDRGDREPARFYTLQIELEDDGAPAAVRILSMVPLAPAGGYAPGALDPEGLALWGDDVWIASEGVARDGVAPFVRRFDRRGSERGELTLPASWAPTPGAGVRDNLGPESLTVSPDGSRLFVASEAALLQDGPEADVGQASWSRLLVYELAARHPEPVFTLAAQHAYRVEPVAVQPADPEGFRVNGLVELLALGRDRLLALERAWAVGGGYALRLYEVDLAAAADVSSIASLASASPAPRPVSKRLALDLGTALAAAGVAPDNLEGLSFGPRLADGRRTVIAVADDNFNSNEQRTLFVVLALSGPDDDPARRLVGR